jgi:hypothetical protein
MAGIRHHPDETALNLADVIKLIPVSGELEIRFDSNQMLAALEDLPKQTTLNFVCVGGSMAGDAGGDDHWNDVRPIRVRESAAQYKIDVRECRAGFFGNRTRTCVPY